MKEPLIPFLEYLQTPIDKITAIENQWQNITLIKWKEVKNTVSLWNEVHRYRDAANCNPLKDIADFALSVLVLPHSNAEVERVFSQMNIVKTKLRNRMETKMANAILGIRAGLRRSGKCCYNYELPSNVLKMIGTKQAYNEKRPELEPVGLHHLATPSTSQSQACVDSDTFVDDDDDDNPAYHMFL